MQLEMADTTPATSALRLLVHLDTDTLRFIVDYLRTDDLMILLQTGDQLLSTKLTSQIGRVSYSGLSSETEDRPDWKRFSLKPWSWPSLLTSPLPKVSVVELSECCRKLMTGHLSTLPPTITKLTLCRLKFVVNNVRDVIFNLPNLTFLELHATRAIFPDECDVPQFDWIGTSLANSPAISNLTYLNCYTSTDETTACIAPMQLLETLTISRYNNWLPRWPPNLRTLGIVQDAHSTEIISLPQTITSLSLPELRRERISEVLQLAPSSLLSLQFNQRAAVIDDNVLLAISRFTKLQSLLVLGQTSVSTEYNLSLLPCSLTKISDWFAFDWRQWQHLPPNVELVCDDVDVGNISSTMYCSREYDQWLPKLVRVRLTDYKLPFTFPALQHVWIEFKHTGSDNALDYLPPTVKTLTVISNNDFFISDGVRRDLGARLPNLASLVMVVPSTFVSSAGVRTWLDELPNTLTKFSLEIRHNYLPPGSSLFGGILQLDDVVLPPNLTELTIRCRDRWMQLPKTIPTSLIKLQLCARSFKDTSSAALIAEWPTTIRCILLESVKEVKEVDSAVRASFIQLRARIHFKIKLLLRLWYSFS